MANIVKDSSNRVYQNPTKLLFLIPIGVIIFVYLFNIIIGLIPIFNVVRKTPAQILARYDI